MNRTEERYAAHLALLQQTGRIARWWFGAFKVRLADKTWYTPDFLVKDPEGFWEWHETKGWMEDDAAVKLKVTSDLYWDVPVKVVREVRDGWTLKDVLREGL
jgi:hypothetical protein